MKTCIKEVTECWSRNFSDARETKEATASFNSSKDSIAFPKERVHMIPFLAAGISSKVIQDVPRNSLTVRKPTTVIFVLIHSSGAFLSCRAV